jgi:hypothetical protein
MTTKRPTLTEAGVGKLFRPSVPKALTEPLPKAVESI